MPIALIVQLAAALIGQTGTFVNLVEYLKGHPGHRSSDALPPEHQAAADSLVAALQAHVQGTVGAPTLPWGTR
jgi:hypothetical protein